MTKVQSLKRTSIVQFAVILLPVVALLAFQSVEDIRRADILHRLHGLQTLAVETRDSYTVFSNHVAAVTQASPLHPSALTALSGARQRLAELGRRADSRPLIDAAVNMKVMADALEKNPQIETLNTLRAQISSLRAVIYRTQAEYDLKLAEVIRQFTDQSQIMAQLVMGAAVLVLLVALLFVWRLIDRLSRPLSLAVSVADRIAEGRPVEEGEFNLRGDGGDLIRSLGRMYRNLNTFKAEVAEYQRGLEEKFEQLRESQSSLA